MARPSKKDREAKKTTAKKEVEETPIEKTEKKIEVKEKPILKDITEDATKTFDPLGESVDEKSYTGANIEVKGVIPAEIPEPELHKTVIEFDAAGGVVDNDTEQEEVSSQQPTKQEPNNNTAFEQPSFEQPNFEQPPTNNEVQNDEPKTKSLKDAFSNEGADDGAERSRKLVKMILKGYKWLFEQGYNWLSLSESKIKKKALKGDIKYDVLFMSMPLNESGSEVVTVFEFIEDYNTNLKKASSVDQEFLDEMENVLTEIFTERGIGMSNEMYVMVALGTDMANRLIGMGTLNYTINSLLKQFSKGIEAQAEEVAANKIKQEQAAQAQAQAQAEAQQPEYSEDEVAAIQKMRAAKLKNKVKKTKTENIEDVSEIEEK